MLRVAADVAAHVTRPPSAPGTARDTALALAARIVRLCPLDRSVESALRAVRALVAAVVADLPDDPARLRATSGAALALCDAVRSEQLQPGCASTSSSSARRRATTSSERPARARPCRAPVVALAAAHRGGGGRPGAVVAARPDRTIRLAGVFERTAITPDGPSRRAFRRGRNRTGATGGRAGRGLPAGGAVRRAVRRADARRRHADVRSADSDWGLLAAAGGESIRSSLVHETFFSSGRS